MAGLFSFCRRVPVFCAKRRRRAEKEYFYAQKANIFVFCLYKFENMWYIVKYGIIHIFPNILFSAERTNPEL